MKLEGKTNQELTALANAICLNPANKGSGLFLENESRVICDGFCGEHATAVAISTLPQLLAAGYTQD